jgi:hypothetical protein
LGVRKQCHFAALDCFRNERKRHQVVEGLPNGHEFQSLQPFLAGERIGARKQFVTNAVEQLDSRRDEAAHRALFCRCQRRGNAAALARPDDNDVIDFEPCDRKRDSGGCAMVPAVFPFGGTMAATLRTTNSSPGRAENIVAGSTRLSAQPMIIVRGLWPSPSCL